VSEMTADVEAEAVDEEEVPETYTTESAPASAPTRQISVTVAAGGTGRRKEAIARVRKIGRAHV